MTEDNCRRVSSSESVDSTHSSTIKQRKKRRWDQPDESLVSAGVAFPGIFPLANIGSLAGITLPTVTQVAGTSTANPLSATGATLPQVFQVPLQQHTAAIVQKFVQPKIQDELIAREIVINDADPAVRYKLTKRHTQEEIQRCTGAVVITRGKYRPPNAPPDGEKPLYLHISGGAHLETTAERIKAVDHAAAMVEEILNQGSVNNVVKANHVSTRVFLGFEADSCLNIASRIRGPNDQYVNHIMHETGATVLLRGRGSGNSENEHSEEAQQPMHLLLSSNDPINLERAKLLAENLLDTISAECGASRVSSCKVYGAVQPPPQLLVGVHNSVNKSIVKEQASFIKTSAAGMTDGLSQGTGLQSIGLLDPGLPQASTGSYPHSSLIGGTSYIGYGGIYPQATPLQQVALALRQSTSPVTATVAPATSAASMKSPRESGPSEKDKCPPQKRKFQELSTAAKGPANSHQTKLQGSEFRMQRELTSHVGARNASTVLATRKLIQPTPNAMPPPPPKSMPPPPPLKSKSMPPPPPPKFRLTPKVHENNSVQHKSKSETVPDTLIKLMEYGDDDDDDDVPEEAFEEPSKSLSSAPAAPKPFWAV